MSKTGKIFAKGGIATAAVGAMALAGATPAQARDRDGIDAGDIIAGAVIIGGIAAIASAASKNNRDRYHYDDYRYRDRDRDRRYSYRNGSPRAAVERCVQAAERDARRSGYRFADVTEIRDVDDTRYGWRVKGRIVVDGNRGWGRYNTRYNRYDRYDRHGSYDRGYDRDAGRFTCYIERGRVTDIDYRGIRGLR
ncbi:hypothetical protein [Altererythrobacter sp. GH1-8]|uniref:hypothetical protein n=1 Tax=Altererythrobacter sp. GH1-8 TaxID=3349333 RepID=UPI00374D4E05